MPYVADNYTTDSGLILTYSVNLTIGYDNDLQFQNIIADSIIPVILIPELTWFAKNPCPTKQIASRYVLISLRSGNTFEIAYPFRPNTSSWFTFWEQLQSPDIVSIKGFGEKATDKFLRNSLGIP